MFWLEERAADNFLKFIDPELKVTHFIEDRCLFWLIFMSAQEIAGSIGEARRSIQGIASSMPEYQDYKDLFPVRFLFEMFRRQELRLKKIESLIRKANSKKA